MVDSRGFFDDQEFAASYEAITSIFIQTNQAPVIIRNNLFEDNVGTMGGVIAIMSPDFEGHDMQDSTPPYNYIEGNTFNRNMAYFTGNAIYYASTKYFLAPNTGEDSKTLCGGGLSVNRNTFENNIGLKKHNGGAIALRCLVFQNESNWFKANNKTSTIVFHGKTNDISALGHITDLYDASLSYEVFRYQTYVHDNTFRANYAGMRGSALAVDFYNHLIIDNNRFESNGPVMSYFELLYSPYVKYLSAAEFQTARPLSSNYIRPDCVAGEFWQLYWCRSFGKSIDLPAMKGAIYIRNAMIEREKYNRETRKVVVN